MQKLLLKSLIKAAIVAIDANETHSAYGNKRLERLRATLANPVRRKRRRNQYWRNDP